MFKHTIYFIFAILFVSIANAQSGFQDIESYKFNIKLSDLSDSIFVKSTIKGNTTRNSVVLNLSSNMYIDSITISDIAIDYNRVLDSVFVKISNNNFNFDIYYRGIPKDGLIIGKNKYGERTFFGDNWPNRAKHWLSVYDHPSDKASIEYIVNAPSKYIVVANGNKISNKIIDNRVIYHYKSSYQLSTKLMVIGVAEFETQILQKSPYLIVSHVYVKDKLEALYDYEIAPQITSYFEKLIDRYPFDKLYNVQSTTRYGGMENAGCIFYDENSIDGKRSNEDLLAHEIAHQWFGNSVSEKNWNHVWLSEGFATYLENMYMENKYGKEKLKEIMEHEKWKVLNFKSRFPFKILVPSTVIDPNTMLNAYSYQKGAWLLHMLRSEVGDEIFIKVLKEYYNKYKYSNANTSDFVAITELVAKKDLKSFFNPWLYSYHLPKYEIKWKYSEGKINGKIVQTQKDVIFTNTVEVLLKLNNGKTVLRRIKITDKETSFIIKSSTLPIKIEIDPYNKILKL